MGRDFAISSRPTFALPGEDEWEQAFADQRQNPLLNKETLSAWKEPEGLKEATRYWWGVRERDKAETQALVGQAVNGSPAAVQHLYNRAVRSARLLYFLARDGDSTAASFAADLASSLVKSLNRLVQTRSQLFVGAATRLDWPAMISVHPKLGDQHKEILRHLPLGWILKHVLSARSKWNPRLPANRIALSLLLHVAKHREAFQRLWEEVWSDPEDKHSPRLALSDVCDLQSLVNKLRISSEPVCVYLRQRLSPRSKSALANYQSRGSIPEDLSSLILQDLNRVIDGESIFDPVRFRNIALRPGTERLRAQCSKPNCPARLNRLFLGDAFPREISRQPPWLSIEPSQAWITRAGDLEVLSRDSLVIAHWWSVAKDALLAAYPDPASVPQLIGLIAKGYRNKSPAGRILQRIEAAFCDICGSRQSAPRPGQQ